MTDPQHQLGHVGWSPDYKAPPLKLTTPYTKTDLEAMLAREIAERRRLEELLTGATDVKAQVILRRHERLQALHARLREAAQMAVGWLRLYERETHGISMNVTEQLEAALAEEPPAEIGGVTRGER